jgi:uncharacterized membrane protein
MTDAPPQRYSHKIPWAVFVGALLLAAVFVNQTASELPSNVAVHFDASGEATSFMATGRYRMFILLFAIGLPIAIVAVMTTAYSRATEFKLPNRDFWLAPQRLERTRSFLVGHGIWFGSLFTGLMSFMHWLVLNANRRQPPYLSNQAAFIGLLVILCCMVVWIGILMVAFRRPNSR